MSQIKDEKKRIARLDNGLLAYETDIKDINHDPSLAYVYDPPNKTKGDLREKARRENFELSKKILSQKHLDENERLKIREDEIFDMGYYVGDRHSLSKLKETRRKDNIDYNMKTFSKQTIGVHGHELPKFADSEEFREFWKFREGWIENPKFVSQTELKEIQKFWKRPEEMKINDYKEYTGPENVKRDFVPVSKHDELIIKVNKLNHFKDFDPDNPRPIDIDDVKRNHIYRWTTLVSKFSNQKFKNGRFFDNLPPVEEKGHEENGMYSSFDNQVFESKYGKE